MTATKDFLDADVIKSRATASLQEAREKSARLQQFYTQQEKNKGWILPNHTFRYLQKHKPESEKRKDEIKQSILHEIDPCLWLSGLYKAKLLPEEITYQIIGEKRFDIEVAGQSIEHLFSALHTHDLPEDFALSNINEMMYFLRQENTNPADSALYEKMIKFVARATNAITFDYKTFDKNREVIEFSKYKGDDRHPYTDDLENIWSAIAAKGADRLGGTIMRYSDVPGVFTYDKQQDYLEETRRLFLHRQTLENMQERYPELKDYFNIVNHNLSIALRCFSVILANHPKNPRHGNPSTARIDIQNFTEVAFQDAEYIDLDVSPMKAMLDGYKALATRMPQFENLVTQMDNQLSPYIQRHKSPKSRRTKELQHDP